MFKLKNIFKFSLFSSIVISSFSLFANESSQSHQKSVSVISSLLNDNGESSVFSAGEDGFLIKWTDADLGEHYQVSEYSIKMFAQNPNGKNVAVYETDGATFNRISVWDWQEQKPVISYRFDDSISNLSYSAQGNYVICSSNDTKGVYFINTKNGELEFKLKESIGSFSFSTTSSSEKTFVTYSPIGNLTYYNLQTGEKKQKFDVEQNLSNVTMFNNSIFIAGIKDRKIYIIHALTGKTIGTFNANNAVLISSESINSENLYYIVNENQKFKIFEIANENGKKVSNPKLLRTFSGLKNKEIITSAAISGDNIFAGTSKGNIYKFDFEEAERVDVLLPITDDRYDAVLDVSPVEIESFSDFYVLTPSSIYKTNLAEDYIGKIQSNFDYKNIITYNEDVILWTKDSKKEVIKLNLETGIKTSLFKPQGNIQSLKICGDFIIDVESNSSVNQYNILTKQKQVLYNGTSIQDAVLCGKTDLYVAKSSATAPNVPLLYVNTKTQETVPLSLFGTFAYALNYDEETSNIYGIVVGNDSSKKFQTSVFEFNLSQKTSNILLSTDNEDLDAFMILNNGVLYTNIGKSNARSYNIKTKRDFLYKRSESMPLKVVRNNDKIMVLNRNGSLSIYNANLNSVLNNYYLDLDGLWNEL